MEEYVPMQEVVNKMLEKFSTNGRPLISRRKIEVIASYNIAARVNDKCYVRARAVPTIEEAIKKTIEYEQKYGNALDTGPDTKVAF